MRNINKKKKKSSVKRIKLENYLKKQMFLIFLQHQTTLKQ